MRINRSRAIAGLAVSFLSVAGVSAANAQEVLVSPAPAIKIRVGTPLEYQNSVNEEFTDAYFDHDRDFFKNRTFPRQLDWLFGFGGFPELEITKDGKSVDTALKQTLARQMASGPIIRVFDLPSPFCQSLRTIPDSPNCLIDGCSKAGCAVVSQPVVAPPPAYVPPVISAPQMVEPKPEKVPALW